MFESLAGYDPYLHDFEAVLGSRVALACRCGVEGVQCGRVYTIRA